MTLCRQSAQSIGTVLRCPACGHEHRREYVPAAALNELRDLAVTVVRAWTRWIDTRPMEWANGPDDPVEDAVDDAIGDLGRRAAPEMYQ